MFIDAIISECVCPKFEKRLCYLISSQKVEALTI